MSISIRRGCAEHLAFHLDHRDGFSTADRVGSVVAPAATVLLAAVMMVPGRVAHRGSTA